jgi:hypothetical protein
MTSYIKTIGELPVPETIKSPENLQKAPQWQLMQNATLI